MFKNILIIILVLALFGSFNEPQSKPANLLKISLAGEIVDVDAILEEIDAAYENESIKGVLFYVNSGGGAVAPSIELAYAIKRLKEKKPVVAYAGGTMASGSYYASIWADKIVANPGSMIGSIGVIMQGVNAKELLDKIGLKEQNIQAGKYKAIGTPFRGMKAYERGEIEKVIGGVYDMFVQDVAKARGLKASEHERFADAHIFTAKQAQLVGLVDSLGVEYDAKRIVEELSGVEKAQWGQKEDYKSELKEFLEEMGAHLSIGFFKGLNTQLELK